MFYYLGLEASVRDNKFFNLPDAEAAAAHCSKYLNMPVRVFCMLDNNKSHLAVIFHPNAPCGEAVRTLVEASTKAAVTPANHEDIMYALKSLERKLGAMGMDPIEFNDDKTEYTVSYRVPKYFIDRRGEEDDDDPQFVGEHEALKAVEKALAGIKLPFAIEVYPADKSWFSAVVRVVGE